MNEFKRIVGATIALGAAACGSESSSTKVEREHTRVHSALENTVTRAYHRLHNCNIRAQWDKEPGTVAAIYASPSECEKEHDAFSTAFYNLQDWKLREK